jgi:hypothetical protein
MKAWSDIVLIRLDLGGAAWRVAARSMSSPSPATEASPGRCAMISPSGTSSSG